MFWNVCLLPCLAWGKRREGEGTQCAFQNIPPILHLFAVIGHSAKFPPPLLIDSKIKSLTLIEKEIIFYKKVS